MYIFVLRQALACDRVFLRVTARPRAVIITRVGYTRDKGSKINTGNIYRERISIQTTNIGNTKRESLIECYRVSCKHRQGVIKQIENKTSVIK